jgi:kynureninase
VPSIEGANESTSTIHQENTMDQKCDHISDDGTHCTEEMETIVSNANRHPGDYYAACAQHAVKAEGEEEIRLAPTPLA